MAAKVNDITAAQAMPIVAGRGIDRPAGLVTVLGFNFLGDRLRDTAEF